MYLRGRNTCIYTHNFLLYPVAMWLLIKCNISVIALCVGVLLHCGY